MGAYDMTEGATGHVSYRIEGTDTMMIKGKGAGQVGLRYTQPRDIVTVDFNADMVDGPDGLQPPSESFLHIWIYKLRPDVKSVVHMHPEYSVLLGITGKEIYPVYGPYRSGGAELARAGVPVYPDNKTIGTAEQGMAFAECMGNKDAALMAGTRHRRRRRLHRAQFDERARAGDALPDAVQGLPHRHAPPHPR